MLILSRLAFVGINLAKLKIGLSLLFCLDKAYPSLTNYLCEVDVPQIEIVDEGLHALNSRRTRNLRKLTQSRDIELTVHGPWADINIASPYPPFRRTILKRLEKSILYARQLGCRLWVFHPGLKTGITPFYPGSDWQLNLDSVRSLLRTANDNDVEIAIENAPEPYQFVLKSAQDFSLFYEELGENLGLVFDVGHANLNNEIQEFIKRFHRKIVHIHVSDNHGTSDSHLGIGYGTIDWLDVANRIKGFGYSNIITVESIEHVIESLKRMRNLFT